MHKQELRSSVGEVKASGQLQPEEDDEPSEPEDYEEDEEKPK